LKTHKKLFEKVVTIENLTAAIIHAARGKRRRAEVIKVLKDVDGHAKQLQELLLSDQYTPCAYRQRLSTEGASGKERLITSIDFFPDQCIHWAIILVLKPVIMNSSYYYSCGCMPGRGVHHGKRAIVKWLKNDRKNTKYCAKIDIKKYYQSVGHDFVVARLKRAIKDHKMLELLIKIIRSYEPGLPIGYLTSQWLGNYMLQEIDYVVKQAIRTKYYIRYMDDMVFFGASKRKLHHTIKAVDAELNKMDLRLKGNWQVFPLKARALDFMGFRFYRHKTTLRRSLMLRITRKVKKVSKKGDKTFSDAAAIISYMGWIKHTDSYLLYRDRIKPYIKINRMINIVRKESIKNANSAIGISGLPVSA
jgi:RNA-directed DNA polymerase